MVRQGAVVGAFLTAVAAVSTTAPALASPSAKLVYVRGPGAESCPSEDDLRKAVANRIGYDPFFPAAQKTVVVQMSHLAGAYRGRVQIVADTGELRGERELPSMRDCVEMVASLGLVVSLALDDLDAEIPSTPTSDPPPAPPSPSRVEAPPPDPPARDEVPQPRPKASAPASAQGRVSLGPGLTVGSAPAPAVVVQAAASVRWGRLGVRLDGRADAPSGTSVAPTGHVSTNAVLGLLSACVHGGADPSLTSLFACAGMGGGVLFARGTGVQQAAADSAALAVAQGRAGATIPIGSRIYLEPSVEGGAHLLRHDIAIDSRQVYRMGPMWGGVGFLLGWRFF